MSIRNYSKYLFLVINFSGIVFGFKSPDDSLLLKYKQAYLQSIPIVSDNVPNILLIVADDLGKYDLSVYGNLLIKTPNIDQLAIEGALFTNGYATAPICAPSRAGLLTGRYQQRFGFQFQPHQRYPSSKFEWWWFKNLINTSDLEPANWGNFPSRHQWSGFGLPQHEITIGEILNAAGYATAWIGKWHLGYSEPMLPQNFGFEFTYGCLEAYTLYGKKNNKNIVNAPVNEFTDKHIWNDGRKGHCAIRKNGNMVDEEYYLTYAFGREAEAFINHNKEKPFFIYMPVTAPHTPYQAPKDIYDSLSDISNHRLRVYYSMIIALDKMVGDLIHCLEKNNLRDKTLIIFTSDNGAPLYSRTITNEPLKGGKFTFYEGGINIPLIMNFPGKIQSKTVVDQPVSLLDLYPTILEFVHLPSPDDRNMDGVHLLNLLSNKNDKNDQRYFYWYSGYNLCIRNNEWKLIINEHDETMELYNIMQDTNEQYELSQKEKEVVSILKNQLYIWVSTLPAARWPRIMDYTFIVNGKKCSWAI